MNSIHPPRAQGRPRRRSLAGRLLWEDRGAALASVALLGTALVVLTAVIVLRGINQHTTIDVDRDWEQAIHVAEGGTDGILYSIQEELPFNETSPGVPLDTKDDVIAAAAGFTAVASPEGDVVAFSDAAGEHVYSIAWTPSRDDPNAKVRVIRAEYEIDPTPVTIPGWSANFALLAGGNAVIRGSGGVHGAGGDVHANGSLSAPPGAIEGCGSETEPSGYLPDPGCPTEPPPPVPIPIIDSTMAYHMSWFDMCPDGQAHAGPLHPTSPNMTGLPCGGDVVPGKQGMAKTATGWANTDKNTPAGVYYVIGDYDGRVGFTNNVQVTIITAKDASMTATLDCSVTGGNIWVSSQSSTLGHPDANGLTLVAAGDVTFRGGADIVGLVLAHEQIDYRGNSSLTGAVIAESACDTPGSPVETTTILGGTADIYWNGPISTPFDAIDPEGGDGDVIVGERIELSRSEL